VVDADLLFGIVFGFSRLREVGLEGAELVVVGIGYPEGMDFLDLLARRLYDFTVADWDLSTAIGRKLVDSMAASGQSLRLGGAPALLDFITGDLQPLLSDRYRLDSHDRALFGASASGNFVAHTLFRRPDAFDKYVAASPAFIYNDWHALQLEEEYAESHADLPVTVYLAAGADEMVQLADNAIVSGTARMAEALQQREYPGLRLKAEVLDGKRHSAAITVALQRGLEMCWPGASSGELRPEDAFGQLVGRLAPETNRQREEESS
jgi:predicted alpha/beta superfamily hydrolase